MCFRPARPDLSVILLCIFLLLWKKVKKKTALPQLIGLPGASVRDVDDAAVRESAFQKAFLHGVIVRVRVAADGGNAFMTPGDDSFHDAVDLCVVRRPVDRSVRHVGGPGAVLDDLVGRVVSDDEGKYKVRDIAFVDADEEVSFFNVLCSAVSGETFAGPLGEVPVGTHVAHAFREDPADHREVFRARGADGEF